MLASVRSCLRGTKESSILSNISYLPQMGCIGMTCRPDCAAEVSGNLCPGKCTVDSSGRNWTVLKRAFSCCNEYSNNNFHC